MPWSEVPDAVVAGISAKTGAAVVSVAGSPLGFSPGFAGIVGFADGERLFLKVMSGVRDPWSIEFNRREAEMLAILPLGVPAPRLRWTLELDEWLVVAIEAVDGEPLDPSREVAHADAIWEAISRLGGVAAPRAMPIFHEHHWDAFTRWQALADAVDLDARLASLGEDGDWVAARLDFLIEWEREAIEASKGDALVHGDLRADNLVLTASGIVIVDWPHASRGAAWLDLVGYLPSHEMYGGGSARAAFRAHSLSLGVTNAEERALVAALAGYFTVQSTEPAVPALPGLREFQRAQAVPALNWLREVASAT